MDKETGGPAFPVPDSIDDGMTLRDYFAAKAMHQFLRGAVLPTQEDRDRYFPMAADVSYQMADAMLRARVK